MVVSAVPHAHCVADAPSLTNRTFQRVFCVLFGAALGTLRLVVGRLRALGIARCVSLVRDVRSIMMKEQRLPVEWKGSNLVEVVYDRSRTLTTSSCMATSMSRPRESAIRRGKALLMRTSAKRYWIAPAGPDRGNASMGLRTRPHDSSKSPGESAYGTKKKLVRSAAAQVKHQAEANIDRYVRTAAMNTK
jgi:hypothetical protein